MGGQVNVAVARVLFFSVYGVVPPGIAEFGHEHEDEYVHEYEYEYEYEPRNAELL